MYVSGPGNFMLEPANQIIEPGEKVLFTLGVQPNPSGDGRWTIDITSFITAPAKATLFDAEGKMVMRQSFFISTQNNHLPVNLPHLPAGEYILTIEALGNGKSIKLIRH
jgi:hypothetical protein